MATNADKHSTKRFVGGIADSLKENAAGQIPDSYYFGRSINHRDDPQAITLLPGAVKETGAVVTDLLKFADLVPTTLTSYFIGDTGKVYSRTSAASWTNLFTVPSSHGNGLSYFSGDDYIYLTGDSNISRYGPVQNSPSFTPNFLTAQGGVPTNTASVLLASASSMSGHAADSATLSVTGDLTLETYFKATTLPTVGNSMTLLGKWDESANTRSYKLDLFGVSGYFGAGSDSSLTISADTTEAPIDSACTGTAGTQVLTATNVSFAAGQIIMVHQTQGTNAGQWERNTIQGYTAGTITLGTNLIGTYTSGAQVRVLKQYTSVTINSGKTYTAKAWNGTVGGILAFLASGTVTVTGAISGNACGFRGGTAPANGAVGNTGESSTATSSGSSSANGAGGGGGDCRPSNQSAAGGGGGNGTSGGGGSAAALSIGGGAGGTNGSNDLTTADLGAGGGSGSSEVGAETPGAGGAGGGLLFVTAVTLTISGSITTTGANGGTSGVSNGGSGGAGSGGSIILKVQTATLGSSLITASGGTGGSAFTTGGVGGDGRIALAYLTSYTGTTTPTLNAIQDNTLVTTTTIQARLGISNNGTSFEYLTQNLSTITTGVWARLSVAWTASTSMATFYLNAVALGTSTGTKTAISDNVSLLYVGADKGASVVGNFFNGLLNDMRIWGNVQSAGQIFANNQIQVPAASAGLKACYHFNSAYTDATGNSNTITPVNSPTFSSDVPFSAPTTRLDIDTQSVAIGDTYTLLTAISEATVDTLNFIPVNDPQASVGFYVDTKGTGDWTVTVHDQQNRVIATKTILAASIPASGFIEFIFSNVWRVLSGYQYHLHLTVSTGTSKVVSHTNEDFSTVEYATYFSFLVPDTQFHPMIQYQYEPLGGTLTGAIIIGNERYVAVWDGANYFPNFIQFPAGWHVRCFAFYRNYLAIVVWRGGNIYDFHQGRVYFWTGYQPAFDFYEDFPQGQINSAFGVGSYLYMMAGFRGDLIKYPTSNAQGVGDENSNKLKRMPLLEASSYTEVFPGGLNMWRGLLHMGLYANSSSTTSQRGVYSYGTLTEYYPNSLSYDYPISTGNRGSSVSVGLVYPVGQNLIIGWRDGIAYGADVINFSNAPASSGEIQLLIDDGGNMWHDNSNVAAKANYLALRAGESISLETNLERAGFTTLLTDSTVGDMSVVSPVNEGRVNEIQLGAILTQTGGTSPTLLALTLQQDPLNEETIL